MISIHKHKIELITHSDIVDFVEIASKQTGTVKLIDDNGFCVMGKNLVFTDDAWETCKVAIGELMFGKGSAAYGINAETIIGNIIVGNNLKILDNNGNEMFSVVDGKISSAISEVEDDVKKLSEIIQGDDGVLIRISALENNKEVNSVTTTTGYTFNADGLTIYKSGEEIKNLLNNTGMYVTRSDEEILTANNEGVSAINLTARQYLIIGANSRLEDYSNGIDNHRTACFFIGG